MMFLFSHSKKKGKRIYTANKKCSVKTRKKRAGFWAENTIEFSTKRVH